jgi:hypothetical protein
VPDGRSRRRAAPRYPTYARDRLFRAATPSRIGARTRLRRFEGKVRWIRGDSPAARAYQQQHPGTRLADALAAVTHSGTGLAGWRPGNKPAIRRRGQEATCYFCGEDTVIASFTDMPSDPGRVTVYCDNSDCDAREIEVVIVDDGMAATRNRTDVRILAHFTPQFVQPAWIGPGQVWAAGTPPYVRTHSEVVGCVFCGEQTCRVSRYDVSDDDARIRLCCSNNRCRVREVEALIMRDEVRSLSEERPDVKALNAHQPAGAPSC